MLSAACLPQVWAEACISLRASWERSKVWTVWTMFGELKVQKRIIVRQTVWSMFGEQTFAQLRMGLRQIRSREVIVQGLHTCDLTKYCYLYGCSCVTLTTGCKKCFTLFLFCHMAWTDMVCSVDKTDKIQHYGYATTGFWERSATHK